MSTTVEDTGTPPEDAGANNAPTNNVEAPDAAPDTPEDVAAPEPACPLEDALAPNQSPEAAHLGGSDLALTGLYVCPDTSDWYAVEVEAGQTIVVETAFNGQFGNLDLYVYSGASQEREAAITSSTSTRSAESARFEAPEAGVYYVEVASAQGSQSEYAISIRVACAGDADCPAGRSCALTEGTCAVPEAVTCGVDPGYEPNETTSTATPVTLAAGTPTALEELSLCPSDVDYYRVTVPAASGLGVTLVHPTDNTVQAALFDVAGRRFGQTVEGARRGVEVLPARSLPAGDYVVVVEQAAVADATRTRYQLTLELLEGSCADDAGCTGAPGREFCDVSAGVCVGLEASGTQALGESCDDDGDCGPMSAGCYEGSAGSGDNVCTIFCNADENCGSVGASSYCIFPETLEGGGICVNPCSSNFECSFGFACDLEAGRCRSQRCGLDPECTTEGESCVYLDSRESGLCLDYASQPLPGCGVGAAPDDGDNGSSSRGAALELTEGIGSFEGLAICDADEDWYTLELTEPSSTVTVSASFARASAADLDVYLYSADGALKAVGGFPDANPERARGGYLPAGSYAVRVNQFPGDRGDAMTDYSLYVSVQPADCRDGGGCQDTSPLRFGCDEATGACVDFEGNGEVALGGQCDSTDDCGAGAELCFTSLGAADGANICTHLCERNSDDCADVPGTLCFPISRTMGLCIFDPR